MTKAKKIKFIRELKVAELSEQIDEYFELDSGTSLLDGNFTSKELRLIADAMDEIVVIESTIE